MKLALLLALALAAGCSSPSGASPRGPNLADTPPTTADPGAVQDRPNTPPSPPPEELGTAAVAGSGAAAATSRADGAACLAASECASGVCEGQGCDAATPGTCAPRSRACTRDLRAYCGCDGKTFHTSGSCPGQRFSSKGECPNG